MTSRNIPESIKRTVRRRCGFGCVVCGCPLVEYDHMVDFAEVREHDPENITLLCPNHHDEKTHGLLPLKKVRHANDVPRNRTAGVSLPYQLHYDGPVHELTLGPFIMLMKSHASEFAAVEIDGETILGFRYHDGRYMLNARFTDPETGSTLEIIDNELVYTTRFWDVSFARPRLVIRASSGSVLLDVRFNPPSRIIVHKGSLVHNGIEVVVNERYILVPNLMTTLSNCLSDDRAVVLALGDVPVDSSAGFVIGEPIPRYLSDEARQRALRQADLQYRTSPRVWSNLRMPWYQPSDILRTRHGPQGSARP